MGRADFLRLGSYNIVCDRCGSKRKAEDTAKEWTGLRVCKDGCLDPRQPQDFVRGVADNQRVPDPRPDSDPVFLEPGDVTAEDL